MNNLQTLCLGNLLPEDVRLLFAPYSNIAQCNIHNVLTYISKRIGLTPDKYYTAQHLQRLVLQASNGQHPHAFVLDDAIHNTQDLENFRILSESDVRGMLPEQIAKLKELFDEHFRMLKPFYNANMSKCAQSDMSIYLKYCEILKDILAALNSIRNLTSHKNAHFRDSQQQQNYERACRNLLCPQSIGGNKISPMKNGLYDSAKSIIIERFNLDDNVSQSLNRYELKGKKYVEKKSFALKLNTNNNILSGIGMLLLVSLFLSKKQVFEFVQGLHIDVEGVKQRYVGELFSVYRIVMPMNKLQCIYPNVAYALDMINELRKCPNELFDILSPGDQQKLRVEGENEGEYQKLLKRNSDRFVYFAQRFIDTMELFKKIRFQVSLGKYRYKFYNKKCVDGASEERVRILQKELNGFGRLDDIERVRTDKWQGLIRDFEDIHQDTAEEKPYITDRHAGYVVYQNKVGLFYPTSQNQAELEKMDEVDGCYLPKIQPEKAACMSPVCWLSIYELPALIFHLLICGNTEDRIIECVEHYYQLFNDVADGRLKPLMTVDEIKTLLLNNYHIEASSVPVNIIDYLTGKNKDIKKAIEDRLLMRIDEEINKTILQMHRFEKDINFIANPKDNRLGRKKHVEIRPGSLAGDMMDDIVRLMPSNENGTNKPTGMNFSVMQANLATYTDGNLDSIRRMFVSAGIIQGNYSHPFLQKVLEKKPKDTITLYEHYLKVRLKYMENLKKKWVLGKTQDLMDLAFLIKGNKWVEKDENFYCQLAKRYLQKEQGGFVVQKTIDLPRGIFLKDVKEKLQKTCKANQDLMEVLSNPDANMAMIIGSFFRYVKGDCNQQFYNWERSYAFLNQVERKGSKTEIIFKKPEDVAPYYGDRQSKMKAIKNIIRYTPVNEKEERESFVQSVPNWVNRMYNDMCGTEKTIRRYKIQDFILLEMAKHILQEYDKESKWDLIKMQDISATSQKNILEKPVSFAFKIKSGNNYNKRIKVDSIKVKDMSKVDRIKSDNRIPTLLDLILSNDISLESIQKELENYDSEQKNIFVDIAEIEDLAGASGGNFGNLLRGINSGYSVLDLNDSKLLVNIRNSFSHNSYLERRGVPQEVLNADTDKKSKSMYDLFSGLTLLLKQNMQN